MMRSLSALLFIHVNKIRFVIALSHFSYLLLVKSSFKHTNRADVLFFLTSLWTDFHPLCAQPYHIKCVVFLTSNVGHILNKDVSWNKMTTSCKTNTFGLINTRSLVKLPAYKCSFHSSSIPFQSFSTILGKFFFDWMKRTINIAGSSLTLILFSLSFPVTYLSANQRPMSLIIKLKGMSTLGIHFKPAAGNHHSFLFWLKLEKHTSSAKRRMYVGQEPMVTDELFVWSSFVQPTYTCLHYYVNSLQDNHKQNKVEYVWSCAHHLLLMC